MTYELKDRDWKRIYPLMSEMYNKDIHFEYFITLNYEERMTDYVQVIEDNKELRFRLRKYFKQPLRFFCTTEKHLKNPDSYFYNSYHRHILMERVDGINPRELESIIKRHHHSVAPDTRFRKGCVVEPIDDFDQLLSYLTKQINYVSDKINKDEIIDVTNSDIGKDHYSVRGLQSDTIYRQGSVLKTVDRSLSTIAR